MFGVYIHFPYCRKRCPYCDFAVHARRDIPHERYERAVIKELSVRAPLFAGRRGVSIYFGGGTPGLWRPDSIARVIGAVRSELDMERELEITVEMNPEGPEGVDFDAHLEALARAGVNRLSIGAQSFDGGQLATLGRLHQPHHSMRAMKSARAGGFRNLSLDLMFALPGQTAVALDRELDALLSLEPDHVSAYTLTIEPRTAFSAQVRDGSLITLDAELQAELYEKVQTRLAAAKFAQYEISSHARSGKRAVHNCLYWTGGEYLGLGCSAHSFVRRDDGGTRFSNLRSVDDYFRALPEIDQPFAKLATREDLDSERLGREALWLGVRLLDGVERAKFKSLYGRDPTELFAEELRRLLDEELVEITDERIKLSKKGVLYADEVGARFV